MKLSAYFPASSILGEGSLYDAPTPGWKRLSVACQHTVSGTVAGRDVSGSAPIQYNLDFRPDVDLGNVSDLSSNRMLALQTRDVVKARVEKLRARLPYDVSTTSPGYADFRALTAVIAAAEAAGAARRPVTYSRSTAEYATVPTGYREPKLGDLYVGPSLCRTAREFVTFLKLCGQAGVKRVFILSDTTMTPEAVPLEGQGLAVFCARVRAHIQREVNDLAAYGAHELAAVVGVTQVMSLNGHSDEGGWLRGLLKSASYPPSTGILACTGSEFNGIPLQENIHKEDILTKVVAEYLSTIALAHVSDVVVNGRTTVYERGMLEDPTINAYGTFASDIDEVVREWTVQICMRDDMHIDAVTDGSAFTRKLNRDLHDRHFENCETIAPWWWVETAPLLTREIDGYEVPALRSKNVELKLFNCGAVSHDSPTLDKKGRVVPGATVSYERDSGEMRMEGASYLFNTRYVEDESLARFKFNGHGRTGAADFLFGNVSASDLDGLRWKTPHNPLPHPLEGLTEVPVHLDSLSVDWATDPTPQDIATGKVESQLGLFYVVTHSSAEKRTTFRTCPRGLRRALKLASPHFQRLYRIEVKSGPSKVPSGPPVTTGNAAPLTTIESNDDDSVLSTPPLPEDKPPTKETVSEDGIKGDPSGESDLVSSTKLSTEKVKATDPLSRPKQPYTHKEIVKNSANEGGSAAPV
jgi:hypothetical protein